jgi:hypothetical protein
MYVKPSTKKAHHFASVSGVECPLGIGLIQREVLPRISLL